jgi:hypothetical protein
MAEPGEHNGSGQGEEEEPPGCLLAVFVYLQEMLLLSGRGRAHHVLGRAHLLDGDSDKDRSRSQDPLLELADEEREAEREAKRFRRRAGLTAGLALVAALLAATSGAAGLTGAVGTTAAAWIAIAAAVGGAASGFLQSPKRVEERAVMAGEWQSLANEIYYTVVEIVSDEHLLTGDPSRLRDQSLKMLKRAMQRKNAMLPHGRQGSPRS